MMDGVWTAWLVAALVTVAVAGTVIFYTVRSGAVYNQEEARWLRLAERGVSAEATVMTLKRGRVGRTYDMGMDMTVRYVDTAQQPQEATLRAYIAEELIANFAPGKHIHIVLDPADPAQIAVDRRRTPTVLP
ncbi:MAG: DUF3592 domain-containing protein [Pigmentiphaga sp.]|uniref:DUF3592 domain-containing protein n=1 Tax=Pigmentiphaga sp. TaxID=1977564 RepID=UPI0029AEC9CC|nr:DUF3592 domain-containing protein [Pigmentiphaga sp.]MDX3905807.1 DUF3592 domain-containing protein [Pigmentiphaga sp.]